MSNSDQTEPTTADANPSSGESQDPIEQLDRDQLRERVREMRLQGLQQLMHIASERFDLFSVWACEAALGIPESDGVVVFATGSPSPRETKATYWTDVATILLEKLNGKEHPATHAGFISIADWIRSRISEPRKMRSHDFNRALEHGRADFLLYDFFERQEELFGEVSQWACELVYHGVPLFRESAPGNALAIVEYTNPDYIYVSKKGQHYDCKGFGRFPYWATSYFFKEDHLKSEKIFFSGDTYSMNEDAISTLREAFRRHIGIETTSGGNHGGFERAGNSLLELVPKVLNRYYGTMYEPNNPDTWTKQVDVISWLITSFQISQREAEAIDIVTRPHQARRKSR